MKKLLSLLLAIAMVISMVPTAFAETADEPQTEATAPAAEPADTIDQATYATTNDFFCIVEDNDELTILSYDGTDHDIIIPSKLGGYPVTTIGINAFYDCDVFRVTIPDSVTTIGSEAFADCGSLSSVTIPDSVTTIGSEAFADCGSLPSVTIPDSVTNIGDAAFSRCISLAGIWVSGDNPKYSSDVMGVLFDKDKTTLLQAPGRMQTSYTIPSSVTTIGNNAFDCCTNLTSVTIPDSVTSIGNFAFSGCTGLTSVTIPDSVTTIGEDAFYGCSDLTSVTIGANVQSIGGGAFSCCSSLADVTIPDSITAIGAWSFSSCDSLTSIIIPDSVTSIGECAFYNCSGLTSVTIPDSVTSIGNFAFSSCTSLTDVYYGGTKAQWNAISIGSNNTYLTNATIHFAEPETPDAADYTYTVENGEATITGYTGAGGDITIPSTLGGYPVTAIGGTAFAFCTSLTSVTIPDSVTTISIYAFLSCTSLTSVTIGNGVTTIGDYVFASCEELTSLTIGDSVKTIGIEAFSGCTGLTCVTIPDSVTTISNYAFTSCTSLTSVTIPVSVTSIGKSVFANCTSLTGICVSEENPNYSSDNTGVLFNKDKTTLIQAPGAISETYTIPDSVTTIGENVFYNCDSLVSVTIPDSVTTIDWYAFSGCSRLNDVYYRGTQAQWDAISIGTYNEDLTNATLHIVTATEVAPTCTVDGYTVRICTCGDVETEVHEGTKLGHTEEILPAVDPTEQTTGLTEGKKCSACDEILVEQEIVPVLSVGTYTINNGEATITGYTGKGGDITIPTTIAGCPVTTIGNYAFLGCTSLTGLTIPDGVTTIGNYAFLDCSSLVSVTIPASVTNFGKSVFLGCDNLTIYGFAGSYAQQYAKANSIPFVVMGGYTASNGDESFATVQEALDAYKGGVIQLQADAGSVTITKDAVVDLNGFSIASVTVTSGELKLLDSKTDDFTVADDDYGRIAVYSGAVKPAEGYIAITEDDGTSFHRVALETTDMTLRGEDAGIYYNCIFSGDELVAKQVTAYGVALSVKGEPEIGLAGTAYSIFHGFAPGENTPSTYLKNVLKQTNTPAQNARNAELQVYGRAYIQIGDTYIYGKTESRSFREQVELADEIWNELTADQKAEFTAMYQNFQSVMTDWEIPNLKASI